jgi:hypothetical protein
MDGTPHERLAWKLSILAVKHGLKPTFFYSEFKSIARGQMVSRSAERIGLAFIVNSKHPVLTNPSSPVEIARYANGTGIGLWIYRKEDTRNFTREFYDFLSSVPGTSQGTLLGYPKCCIQWYEKSVEKPQGLEYMELLRKQDQEDAEAAMKAMDSPLFVLGSGLGLVLNAIENKQAAEVLHRSMATFPFIPHVACSSCLLARDSSPSSAANTKFGELARSASSSLYYSILKEGEEEIRGNRG